MTHKQEIEIKRFLKENKAKVTAMMELPASRLVVTYSVPQAPGQESLTALYLPEWAEVIYSALGTELQFDSSWDQRRRIRQTTQAAWTGSLVVPVP